VTRIAILGAGIWGTALSLVLSRSPRAHEISLWVRDAGLADEIRRKRENLSYLPGHTLPDQVHVAHDLDEALSGTTIVIGAMPSAHAREVYSAAASRIAPRTAIVSATKGLEPATHARMSEVIAQVVPAASAPRLAVISGPSFALEVAHGAPTAVVLASHDSALAGELQEEFAAPNFRLYTNDDMLGVELAGAMKNVIAIAAGTCQGLELGSNSLAALITRGLAEMSRLAATLGARPETLSGLAGLGDLVLTCTGSLSRNRRVGIELGKGRLLHEIISGMHGVAEGVGTTSALLALARENKIDLPITEQVDAILHQGKAPREAIRAIMERPQRKE
jgi:glycerol-3-phosphate dehydrogenase (NAD(P)+)